MLTEPAPALPRGMAHRPFSRNNHIQPLFTRRCITLSWCRTVRSIVALQVAIRFVRWIVAIIASRTM